MIIYGANCSPTLVGVSGTSKFKKYKADIVSNITSVLAGWSGASDTYLGHIQTCGSSTVKDTSQNYTEVLEITKDAHQSQTIANISYTHFQLEATSTRGWLNNRRIHLYASRDKGGYPVITFDYGGYRWIYEDDSGRQVKRRSLTFNMEYL